MKFHIKFYLSLLFILVSFLEPLKASHAVGGEITYRCLGNYQYEIHFTFYRDCAGIPVPMPMILNIENSCGYPATSVALNISAGSPVQIDSLWLCPSATSTCNGGLYTGMEKWDFNGIITLPGGCIDWTFSHTEAVRNSAITTMSGGGNLFVYSICNNINGVCHDSPVFSSQPVMFLCLGEYFCYNNNTFTQGDSITYQLITPRTGPNYSDTITYLPGYSAQQPLISSPPITFSTNTGDICMHPSQADVTPIAVLANQYLNGILVGQVERDIQVTVHVCSNNTPTPPGFNGTPFQNRTVCANQQNCFYVTSLDPDTLNTTILTWNNINGIPGLNVSQSGGKRDTLFYCWTPTNADASNNPHCFSAEVSDDNCPYFGKNHSTLCLTVDTSSSCIATHVKLLEAPRSFTIYPQPATNKISLDLGSSEVFNSGTLRIFDSFGKSVYSMIIPNNQFSIDINLPSGIFYAIVMNEKGTTSIKKQIIILKD